MARVNVYLPDRLAAEARRAELNVSQVTQEAVRAELQALDIARWLDSIAALPSAGTSHGRAMEALRAARDEIGG